MFSRQNFSDLTQIDADGKQSHKNVDKNTIGLDRIVQIWVDTSEQIEYSFVEPRALMQSASLPILILLPSGILRVHNLDRITKF